MNDITLTHVKRIQFNRNDGIITDVMINRINKIAEIYNIDLFSKKRTSLLINIKYGIYYYLYKVAKLSTIKIGAFFGVGHDTISRAVKRYGIYLKLYPYTNWEYSNIKNIFEGKLD